jgi:hypothetical protein
MSMGGEHAFRLVLAIVDRYRTAKDQEFPSGARLVCPLPWIHQNSWLHRVMPPCPEDSVATLATTTATQPPHELVEFLRCANGLSLFNGSLSVFGVRGDFGRSLENALLLPYDLADHHIAWSRHFRRDDFLLGTCGADVDPCVWRAADGRVDRMTQQDGDVLESWPSFHDWLMSEADRYATCHSANGHLLDPLPDQPGKAKPWPQAALVVGRPKRRSPAMWWSLEERFGLPSHTLPLGWLRKLQTRLLERFATWLERK